MASEPSKPRDVGKRTSVLLNPITLAMIPP